MKKSISLILALILILGVAFSLASCSKVSASYADKINEAVKNKEPYTYERVIKELGDEAIASVYGTEGYESGFIVAIKGVTDEASLEKLVKEGTEVEGLFISITLGKASYAKYGKIDESMFK